MLDQQLLLFSGIGKEGHFTEGRSSDVYNSSTFFKNVKESTGNNGLENGEVTGEQRTSKYNSAANALKNLYLSREMHLVCRGWDKTNGKKVIKTVRREPKVIDFYQHLQKAAKPLWSIGVYPNLQDGKCSFLGFDIEGESKGVDCKPNAQLEALLAVLRAYDEFKGSYYVSISASSTGFHLEVFFETPQLHEVVRSLGISICKAAGLILPDAQLRSNGQISGDPCRQEAWRAAFGSLAPEVFPSNGNRGRPYLIPLSQTWIDYNGGTAIVDEQTGSALSFDTGVSKLLNVKPMPSRCFESLLRYFRVDPGIKVNGSTKGVKGSVKQSKVSVKRSRGSVKLRACKRLEVIDRVSLRDVASRFGIPIPEKDRGSCPLHGGDNTGAFSVRDNLFSCFTNCEPRPGKAQAVGGPIELLARYRSKGKIPTSEQSRKATRDIIKEFGLQQELDRVNIAHQWVPRSRIDDLDPKEVVETALESAKNERGGTFVLCGPCGVGKTKLIVDAIVQSQEAGNVLKVVVAADSHAFKEELKQRFVAKGLKDHGTMPEINDDTCVEGKAKEIKLFASQGLHYGSGPCGTCPKNNNGCRLQILRQAAQRAHVVFTTKKSLTMPGAFESDGVAAGAQLLIIEEDISEVLYPSEVLTLEDLRQAELLKSELFEPELHSTVDELKKRAADLIELANSSESPARLVLPWREKVAPELLKHIVKRLSRDAFENGKPKVLGHTITALGSSTSASPCALTQGQNKAAFRVRIWRPLDLPNTCAVLNADATADIEFLEKVRGETLKAEAGIARKGTITQYRDMSWSKKTLKCRDFAEKTVRQIESLIDRHKAERIGLIMSREFIEQGQSQESPWHRLITRKNVEHMYFYNLRGRDSFKGVNLLFVVGTPRPAEMALQERAVLLGADNHQLRETVSLHNVMYRDKTVALATYEDELMWRSWLSLISTELEQAVGRGLRGDNVPEAVYVFSNAPFQSAHEVRLTTLTNDHLRPLTEQQTRLVKGAQELLERNEELTSTGLSELTGISTSTVAFCKSRIESELGVEFTRHRRRCVK